MKAAESEGEEGTRCDDVEFMTKEGGEGKGLAVLPSSRSCFARVKRPPSRLGWCAVASC